MNTQNILESYLDTLDLALDSSEYYDYGLGDDSIDYVFYEYFESLNQWLLTEDGYVLITEDKQIINY